MSQTIEQEVAESPADVAELPPDVAELPPDVAEDKEGEKAFYNVSGTIIGICYGVTMTSFAIPGMGFVVGGLCGLFGGYTFFYLKNPEEFEKDLEQLPENLANWWNNALEGAAEYERGGRGQRNRDNFTYWYNRNQPSVHQQYWKI